MLTTEGIPAAAAPWRSTPAIVVTHQFLLKEVWARPTCNDTHYLRIFVRKLRQKIEADPTQPRILLTELGVGYRLVVPEPASNHAVAS